MELKLFKKPIVWLIVFMSVSLLGIILVQFFWISRAVEVQRNQINWTIYEALHASLARLEKERNADFFLRYKGINPQSLKRKKGRGKHHQKIATSPINQQIYISPNGIISTSTQYSYTYSTQLEDKGLDGKLLIPEGEMDDRKDLPVPPPEFSNMEDQESQILEWFNRMNNELSSHSQPLQSRLMLSELAEVLSEEFSQRGISAPFEYGVVDKNTMVATPFRSAKFNAAEQENRFDLPLFPKDFFRGISPYYLQVNFADFTTLIFSSLGWLLGASLVFTIFILVAFLLTIRTILTQKRVSEIKNDFINNMTHEFKTPIATISLATDSIGNSAILSNPDRIKSFLSIIKEENKRMNKQVERILQMSLLEKKDFQLLKSQTNVNQLVVKVVDRMKLLAQQNGGAIVTYLDESIPEIQIDEVHFTNVIHNLIDNAIKYTDKAPEISVSSKMVNGAVELAIADNGLGLTKEQQERVFEKFYRVHTGNQHNVKGFGLGLSYVKAIVNLHGGDIKISSKLGVGSTFYVTIPLNC